MKLFQFIIILCLFLISCNSIDKYPKEIERALDLAGSNRIELEKLLAHYSSNSADSLKLRAAEFLIVNMPIHRYLSSNQLDKYNHIFDKIAELEKTAPLKGNYNFPITNQLWNSISSKHGKLNHSKIEIKHDCKSITHELLIENIDYAFSAWNLPWAKSLTFNEFCEYILPYRFDNEQLEHWRPEYWKKYSGLIDSCMAKNSADPIEICRVINNDVAKWFRFNTLFYKYPCAISPSNLLKAKMGKCLDQAGIANFTMRAIGIPVVHEYIPQWANRSMGHDFSAVLRKDKEFIGFLGGELPPGENELREVAPKIFRKTFSIQYDKQLHINKNEVVPPFLEKPNWTDVTNNYVPVSEVTIILENQKPKKVSLAYLSVFNNSRWIPVFYGEIKHGQATFTNMGRNAVYLPVYYTKKGISPAARPVILNNLGSTEKIQPDLSQLESVRLIRKYPLSKLKRWWMTLLIGGEFQGATYSDFSDAETLYTIKDTLDLVMHTIKLSTTRKFRYIRYKFPDNKFGSLSELVFFDSDQKKLDGKIIKADGVQTNHAEIAFDGKH